MLSIDARATLDGGVEIPLLGLGVYQSAPGDETYSAVLHALRVGYRHIDTARVYRNEADVGRAMRDSGIPRDEIFVTTKLSPRDHGYDATLRAAERSARDLGIETIDLYLIHWPVPQLRGDSWRAMEVLRDQGKCRAIGVSNYTIRHLEELLATARIGPAVNQVEFNPFLHQAALHTFCSAHGIRLEAYSPLAQGQRLQNPALVKLARQYGRSGAQLMLRWALQREIIVIPKSVRPARIEENAALFDFELTPQDMATLDGLHEDLRTCWDPTHAP